MAQQNINLPVGGITPPTDPDRGDSLRVFMTKAQANFTEIYNFDLAAITARGATTGTPIILTNSTNSTTVNDGALRIAGGVGIGLNLNVGGTLSVGGTSIITGNATFLGAAGVAQSLTVGQSLSVGGALILLDSTESTSSTTGALRVAGGVGIARRLTVGGALVASASASVGTTLSVLGSTSSTSTTSGALTVTGGAGVGQNLNVGGNLVVSGNLTVNGSQTVVNTTTVTVTDPVFQVGGASPPSTDDNFDRGIAFHWHDGVTGRTGFFGHKDDGRMVYIPIATETSPNVFTGPLGTIAAAVFEGDVQAVYADLAERYAADAPYPPGTVVIFGGEMEVSTSGQRPYDTRVAGVVSTQPGLMLNSGAGTNATHPYLALTGRVPCFVTGIVHKGDLIVASDLPGHGMAADLEALPSLAGRIIGRAIKDKTDPSPGLTEIAVQRG